MKKYKKRPGSVIVKRTRSKQPRKQRKYYYNTPKHQKRKCLSSHLSEELLLKYNVRSVPVIKGDQVKVMRGALKGHIGNIVKVSMKKKMVTIEGATIAKADGTQLTKWIHPSNVLIVKLDLTDPWRRRKLGELAEPGEITEEAEEEGQPVEEKASKVKKAKLGGKK